MLVATFGPSTGWAGKTITFEDDHFVLEGHGPITAHDVMEYDRQAHLVWASDGTRAWVGSRALGEAKTRPEMVAGKKTQQPAQSVPIAGADDVDTNVPLTGTLLATFGPSSEQAGMRIVQQRYVMVLEERGPISPRRVMEYDGQGMLIWASEEMRSAVQAEADKVSVAAESAESTKPPGEIAFKDGQFVLGREHPRSSAELVEMQGGVAGTLLSAAMPPKARRIYDANNGPRSIDFVIEGLASQCLVALPDSCIIVKPGFMAGATGGGRFTEFHYSDITGIEVNSGMINATLEVTTPAYQGKSKEYWNMGRNSDPFKVSNCLPGNKLLFCQGPGAGAIEELRRRVRHAKQKSPSTIPAAAIDPAEQIRKLAELRDAGVLSPEEFDEAKRRILEAM